MSFKNKMVKSVLLVGVATTIVTGCSKELTSTYVEKVEVKETKGAVSGITHAPGGECCKKEETGSVKKPAVAVGEELGFTWKTPEGWTETRSNGIVIAKFTIANLADYRCYITRLRGNGGGLEPNIQRWLGQIGLPQISKKIEMAKFVAKQDEFKIQGGHAMLIDFTSLIKGDQAQSMMVGIISFDDQTLYIKMLGAKSAITPYKKYLIALTESVVQG